MYPNDEDAIRSKILKFCLYQERCPAETRQKLKALGASEATNAKMLSWLEEEGYVNEARFAREFTHGKFTLKKWGKIKIRHELRGRGIDETNIETALAEAIDPDIYEQTVQKLIEKKRAEVSEAPILEQKSKISAFLLQKGYEWERIIPFL